MKGTPPSGSKQLAFAQVPSKRDNVKYALLVSFAHLYSVLRIRGELQEGGAQGDTESLREQRETIFGLGTKDENSGRPVDYSGKFANSGFAIISHFGTGEKFATHEKDEKMGSPEMEKCRLIFITHNTFLRKRE